MQKETDKYSLILALNQLQQVRKSGAKIVFTNGCFDILHVGHLRYLTQAKALGDFLIIGVNSDSSVKNLKGEQRPIVSEAERCEMLLGLKVVNSAVIFSEPTPLDLIKSIKPDVLCKGGDWAIDKIVGADFVQSYGGKVFSLPFVEGRSSSAIIEKIIKC